MGDEYRKTFHNAGYLFIDELIKEGNISPKKTAEYFNYREWTLPSDQKIYIIEPRIFMNASGGAVKKAMSRFKITPKEILIVHDDSDISIGKSKFSIGVGSAGHNGVESIVKAIGTKDFWRLRIGIRSQKNKKKAMDFVLKNISPANMLILKKAFRDIRSFLSGNSERSGSMGFTLFELLIYITIFTLLITGFVAIFFNVLRVQNRQVSTTEVATELQFAMQTIEQRISSSKTICYVAQDEIYYSLTNCSTYKSIKLENNTIIEFDNSSSYPITSDSISIDTLNFVQHDIPNASRPLITIEIQGSYKDGLTNPQKAFTQTLRSAARPR